MRWIKTLKTIGSSLTALRLRIPALGMLLFLAACGEATQPPPVSTAPVVRDEARVLNSASRAALQEVTADGTLVFSSTALSASAKPASGGVRLSPQDVNPSQFKVGDVIVSQPSNAAPYGLLRKVSRVDTSTPGQLRVETTQGRIGDALKKGTLEVTGRTLEPSDVASVTTLAPGAQVRLTPQATGLTYSIDVVLRDQDGNLSTTNDQIRASGSISLKPSFDVALSLDCGFACVYDNDLDFRFKLNLEEQAKLKIVGAVAYGASIELSVFKQNFTPIVFFIGPVPVVITPRLVIKIKLDGSVSGNFEFESTQTLNAGAGVKYDGGWSALSNISNDFTASLGKASLSMNATAKAPIQAEFLFYGVVGPTIAVAAKLNMDAVVPRKPIWKLNGGVEGQVGIKVDVLGYTKEFSQKLFDLSREIAQAGNTAPGVAFRNPKQNENVDVNICCNFSVNVNDLEDGASCCAVTFSSNVDGALGTGSGSQAAVGKALTTLGPRTITAIARDADGATTSTSVTINVVNTPPTVAISTPFSGQTFYQGLTYTLRGSSYDPNELPTGELPCTGSNLKWTSSVTSDPQVTGCDPQIIFASSGPRTLTLRGTDAFGATGTATVAITVLPPPANLPPVVNVISPKNNLFVGPDSVLTLTGSATDPEGSAVTTQWDATVNYDPANPNAGTPVTITLSATNTWKPKDNFNFGCGFNTLLRLRFRATDAQGNENSDFVVLRYTLIC